VIEGDFQAYISSCQEKCGPEWIKMDEERIGEDRREEEEEQMTPYMNCKLT
jgi:hypothetical protein